ncbi:hypothetical protein M3212_08070 [Alkalihalobacillus oceani]|uniref:hypothetical protein n=1 Tax=Halalkalibacter oceani TaxID=1653776 RepID=UPI00203EC52E|nr:hypothetical protein [Halalkalibacter oceani]MCM3760743.1 hypothetical protein [Halalkalibacter oceani]
MKLLMSLLFVVLLLLTTLRHMYFVWKEKDYKMFIAQVGIVGLAVLAGIYVIHDFSYFSISNLLNTVSPLEK